MYVYTCMYIHTHVHTYRQTEYSHEVTHTGSCCQIRVGRHVISGNAEATLLAPLQLHSRPRFQRDISRLEPDIAFRWFLPSGGSTPLPSYAEEWRRASLDSGIPRVRPTSRGQSRRTPILDGMNAIEDLEIGIEMVLRHL